MSCYNIPCPKYPLLWYPLPQISHYSIPCPDYSIPYSKYNVMSSLTPNILLQHLSSRISHYSIPYPKHSLLLHPLPQISPFMASPTINIPFYGIPYPKYPLSWHSLPQIPHYSIPHPKYPIIASLTPNIPLCYPQSQVSKEAENTGNMENTSESP